MKKIKILKPEKSVLEKGNRVQLNLDYHIATKKKAPESTITFWKEINGGFGIVSEVVSDDEIWVVGEETLQERKFNSYTLTKV